MTVVSPSFRAKLSVCMIVRDEVRVLQRCLDSLGNIFDELVVVDTGSDDDTMELARRNGAIVDSFMACNDENGQIVDFAMARNRALSLATGEWILQIDADEVLKAGTERILQHTKNIMVDHVGVQISSEGANWTSVRLFRQIDGLRYSSRIHEYLSHSGVFAADRSIIIENLPDKANKETAQDRNIRLCRLALSETPEDGRLHHYLANEYRKLRRFNEAIDEYRTALECGNYRIGIYHTSYYLGICYLLQESWDEAISAAMQCLRIDPRYAEAPCLLGDIYSLAGNKAYAVQWYQTALQKTPPADAVMAIQEWAYHEHPKSRLDKLTESD